jgi:DnaJ-class molecular chaperone
VTAYEVLVDEPTRRAYDEYIDGQEVRGTVPIVQHSVNTASPCRSRVTSDIHSDTKILFRRQNLWSAAQGTRPWTHPPIRYASFIMSSSLTESPTVSP